MGGIRSGAETRAGRVDRHHLVRVVVIVGNQVVAVAGVTRIPLVATGYRAAVRQGVTGWGRVSAIAVDGDRFGVDRAGAAIVIEREGDGAGLVITAREHRR